MHPTYLSTALILPGLYMEDGKPPHIKGTEFYLGDISDGFAFIDNESLSIYSIEKNKVITIDEIKVGSDNYLEEDLLIIRRNIGIDPECDFYDFSSTNFLDDGDWNDFLFDDANMQCIYEIVKKNYDFQMEQALKNNKLNWIKDNFIFNCSFIALWQEHTSQGFEDLYPEIDCIEFCGEGYVKLIEDQV